jgi:hypothetical protein
MLYFLIAYLTLGYFLANSEGDLTGFNFDSFIAVLRAPYLAGKELLR